MAYARGLNPIRYQDGTTWNGATQRCAVLSDYAVALFVGDPVVFVDAGGAAIPATTNAPTESDVMDGVFPIINIATAGAANVIWGVITSFEPQRGSLSNQYLPASTGGTANVCRATPDLIFELGTSAALTVADINEATDLSAGAGGSTSTGYSSWVLDQGGLTTASQVYITGFSNRQGNYDNLTGTDAIWECSIQAIQFGQTPTGLGLSA